MNQKPYIRKTTVYKKRSYMMTRCYNKNRNRYHHYGGRGIGVCDRWKNSRNFYEDMNPSYFEGASLDRIDNDGDYCPENCKWVTLEEQRNNKQNTLWFERDGKRLNLKQWCTELGLDYKLIYPRVRIMKWSFEKAITTPVKETYAKAHRIRRENKRS